MKETVRVIESMLQSVAEPVIKEMPKVTSYTKEQLREIWLEHWDRALAESEGDMVKLADAVCDELKMFAIVTIEHGW